MMHRFICLWITSLVAGGRLASAQEESAIRMADENTAWRASVTPDFAETISPKSVHHFPSALPKGGPVVPSARQPMGALSGRIVFMNSGHGWTFDPTYWRLQRGTHSTR